MPDALIAALVFLSAAGVSAAGVRPLQNLATRFQLLDQPGEERRVHTHPLPRIGGIAIFLGFILAIGVSMILPVERFAEEVERITLMIIGATVVVVTMFFDDVIGIRPVPKLLLQIGAALIVVLPRLREPQSGIIIEQFNVPFFGTVSLPLVIAIAFTVFWIVGMMNTVNWSDGLDGLAGSIVLTASIILFLHTFFWPSGNPQFTISLLAAALAGAVVGFLPFNWHPSRIIMGDTGAMFLGFTLAIISVIGGAKIAAALLALGVPIVDTAWLIIYRTLHGRSPMSADRGHLHHRLLDAGWSQPQIVLGYTAIALTFGFSGLLLPSRELKFVALVLLGVLVLGIVGWFARQESPNRRASSVTSDY